MSTTAERSSPKTIARAQAQRARILDAARACFAERGFHGASIANIAQAADISQGLIYRYFTNKAAIVHAIIDEQRIRRRETLAGIASCEALIDVVMLKLQNWRVRSGGPDGDFDPALFLEITAEATRDVEVAAVLAEHERSIWSDLTELIRRSAEVRDLQLAPAELQQRTLALRCLLDGMVLNWVRDPAIDAQQMRASLHAICASLLA
jgi:AcrR family transcriptional regulator